MNLNDGSGGIGALGLHRLLNTQRSGLENEGIFVGSLKQYHFTKISAWALAIYHPLQRYIRRPIMADQKLSKSLK